MVPYIPSLLLYLRCYIYVDIYSSVTVFIYLFKYLFKGPDGVQFCFQIVADGSILVIVDDEFEDYIKGQYLSSSEAVYRILSFNIISKRSAIWYLLVYLENSQLG